MIKLKPTAPASDQLLKIGGCIIVTIDIMKPITPKKTWNCAFKYTHLKNKNIINATLKGYDSKI